MLPIFLAALAALALTFLSVSTSAFAGDRVGQPAGGLRDVSVWWLLPLVCGLAGLGGLLVVLDRHHYFDELD